MIIVGNDRLEVETELVAGGFGCPACSGVLRPWGSARGRVLRCAAGEVWRHPRRGRCVGCGGTHVLLTVDSLVRRRDEVAVIGSALVMKAAGRGHRIHHQKSDRRRILRPSRHHRNHRRLTNPKPSPLKMTPPSSTKMSGNNPRPRRPLLRDSRQSPSPPHRDRQQTPRR